MALGVLYVAGLLLAGTEHQFRELGQNVWFSLLAFGLLGVVILLQRWQPLLAAWLLVLGTSAAVWLAVTWGGLPEAIWLVVLPIGVATLAIGISWGVGLAVLWSLLLLLLPPALLPAAAPARIAAAVGLWFLVALLWSAVQSLLTSLQWAWSAYEQNRLNLEIARDTQVRLYQMTDDLAKANLQLSRLNRLAQALRQTAEDERTVKERFVANVSHELRTPLNMIIGFCEMITSAPESYGAAIPSPLLADLNVVLRNSQHLSSLIDDVLDISQIEAGRMALSKERGSLAEIIEAAALAVRPLFSSKGLHLKIDIPSELPLVLCDRTRIREVVLNLLSNAGRFTDRGGVTVQARPDGIRVVVSVADTGPGIAEAQRTKLFLPFEQLDGSIRRRYGGTGLGLSISKSFVELHEGEMWVESEVGRGTTFFFSLPIEPSVPLGSSVLRWYNPYEPYEDRPQPAKVKPAELKPRLVVVEPADAMRRMLDRYLDGVEIVPAAGLEEAFTEISRTPAQALIVNDFHIADALQRVRASKALPYGVPAIICAIPGAARASEAMGAFDYLVKPISRQSLISCLERLGQPLRRILLVDDEPDALQLFGRMLNEAYPECQVIRASNGRQALDVLRQTPPDAVLLDLVMPDMDGFQLLAIKRSESALRSIPVILISARDPLGQPIVSDSLAVTCRRGMSAREVLACIDALSRILSCASVSADRGLTAEPLE